MVRKKRHANSESSGVRAPTGSGGETMPPAAGEKKVRRSPVMKLSESKSGVQTKSTLNQSV